MKKMMSAVCALAFVVVGARAVAGSLEDAKVWDGAEKTKEVSQKKLQKACGSGITLSFDKDSFKNAPTDGKKKEHPGSTCGPAYSAIESMCGDSKVKPTVVSKIKEIQCKYDAGDKPTMAMEGSKLVVGMHERLNAAYSHARNWLEKNL